LTEPCCCRSEDGAFIGSCSSAVHRGAAKPSRPLLSLPNLIEQVGSSVSPCGPTVHRSGRWAHLPGSSISDLPFSAYSNLGPPCSEKACVLCSGPARPGGAGGRPRGALLLVRTACPFFPRENVWVGSAPSYLPTATPRLRPWSGTVHGRFCRCDNDMRGRSLVGNPCQPRSTRPLPWACGQVGVEGQASKAFKGGD
jgi:hypothetical protein